MIRLLSEAMQGIHVRAESAADLNLDAVLHPTAHHGRAKTSANVFRAGSRGRGRGKRGMGRVVSQRHPPRSRGSAGAASAPRSNASSNGSAGGGNGTLTRRKSLREVEAAEVLELKQQLRAAREEAKSLRKLNHELSSQVAESTESGTSLNRVVNELDDMKEELTEQAEEYELRIVEKNEEISKLKDRITELEIENAELRDKHEKTKTHLQGRINKLLTKYDGISEELSTRDLHSPTANAGNEDLALTDAQHDAEVQLIEKNRVIARLERENERLQDEMREAEEKHKRVVKTYKERLDGILGGYKGVRQELGRLSSTSDVASPRRSSRKSSERVAQSEFQTWLNDTVKLPQYLSKFVDAGADKLPVVAGYAEVDLRRMGINRKVHRDVILTKIEELKASGVSHDESSTSNAQVSA